MHRDILAFPSLFPRRSWVTAPLSAALAVVLSGCSSPTSGADGNRGSAPQDAGGGSNDAGGGGSTDAHGDASGNPGDSSVGRSDAGSSGGCTSTEAVCPKGCANLDDDVNNCGSCGYECPAPAGTTPTCHAGSCGMTCSSPSDTVCQTNSSAACVNLASDPQNCGRCGYECGQGSNGCSAGVCTCPVAVCDGFCVDTNADANNCGGCGVSCSAKAGARNISDPSSAYCSAGACLIPIQDAFADFNCTTSTCDDVVCSSACRNTYGASATCDDTIRCDNTEPPGGACVSYGYFDDQNQLLECDNTVGLDCATTVPPSGTCVTAGGTGTGILANVTCFCSGTASL